MNFVIYSDFLITCSGQTLILCTVMSVKAASLSSPIEDRKWFIVNQSDEKERSASQLVIGSVHPITSNL